MEHLIQFLKENEFEYENLYYKEKKVNYLKVYDKKDCNYFDSVIFGDIKIRPSFGIAEKENHYYILLGCHCDGGSNHLHKRLQKITFTLSEFTDLEINVELLKNKLEIFRDQVKKYLENK